MSPEVCERIAGTLCAAWYKADNRALKAIPGSPRQIWLREESRKASEAFHAFMAEHPNNYIAPHLR